MSSTKSENKNVHAGHRKRVRENVMNNGFSQLEDHRLLELLLFYSVPQGDTNGIAHDLLDRFGSLGGVISASPEELMTVNGVGQSTAIYLNSLSELVFRVSTYPHKKHKSYKKSEDMAELVRSLYVNVTVEKIYVLCFDSGMRLIKKVLIGEGDSSSTEISIRKVTEAVVSTNASRVVLVHNHPFCDASPSVYDIDTTRNVAVMLRKLESVLCDHIIVGCDGDYYAISEDEQYSKVLY